jgi:two-component system, NarL family, sensor kinase
MNKAFIAYLFSVSVVFAKKPIKASEQTYTKDSLKVRKLIKQGNKIELEKPQIAYKLYKEAEKLSQKIDYKRAVVKSISNFTYILDMESKLVESKLFNVSVLGYFGYHNLANGKKLAEQENIQLRQQQQLTATESIIKGQEEERSRLARDLHDGPGGILSGIKLTLNNMTENVILSEQNALTFDRALGQLDTAISEMRRVAHSMMPETLIKFGLTDALNDFCDGISQSGKLKVRFLALGMASTKLPQTTEVTLYRIVQELLNNTLKHANATEALVQLSKNDNLLSLSVEDNGRGFDTNNILTSKGIGMKNIENRVAFLNGTMDIKSEINKGTSVFIEFDKIY